MTGPSLLDRLKGSLLVHVLILYLGASWVVIEVSGELPLAPCAEAARDISF
ncbi:MAG TPA: hypothetical protein VK837_12335 [Longimicrobiales bacterium]|nr:hypothetical protein [Longimicrobiales bacterium]